jgi:D-threonate/D-erythronate kinase
MAMPQVLVIADDLTGATDTAHSFAKRGYDTAVQVDIETAPSSATVLAVNTASRYVDSETARNRVIEAVSEADADIVYNKVDSTLRGNVVPEISGIMSRGFDCGLFAPAAPTLGRVTAAGYHLIDGELLSDTEYAADPKGPTCSHLPTLIESIDRPVDHIDIGTTATGANAVREGMLDGPLDSVVVCDGTHSHHLSAVADAGETIDRHVVYIGSSGLAEHISVSEDPHRNSHLVDLCDNGALGIIGSVSETTLSQIQSLPDDWILELTGENTIAKPERAGTTVGEQASRRIASNEPAVITAAVDNRAVERTFRAGERLGVDNETVRVRVASALANAAETAFAGDPAGLFITGGETAMSVFGRLNVASLSLSGNEIEAGVPVSRLQGGPAAGTPVITKAGGFGVQSTAINCLRYLGSRNE